MNTTKTFQAVSPLRSPHLFAKRIPTKSTRLSGLHRLDHSRFASIDSQLPRGERNGKSDLRGILTIAIPSILLTWAVLRYYDPHQRSLHSKMMKQRLQNENKTIGRAHDCAEVHLSDVEKWAEQHPEHSEHWKRMKKAYEESNR